MNKSLKYSLIALALALLSFCIFIVVISSLIYSKGLSLDPVSGYLEKRISNFSPGSDLQYKEAILKYNKENGLYVEVNKLIYQDSNTDNTFDIDSLRINFDFLSLWNNENKNVKLDLERIRIFNQDSFEIANGRNLSINIENENLIKFTIDKAIYKSAITAVSLDYLSAKIRNKKDTVLNISNIDYDNFVSNISLNLDSSLIRLNIDSILNDKKSNFYVKSRF